jgi:methylglutaconyl-CoA hydratase
MSDAPRVQTTVAEGVLTVLLNRPDKRNALDGAMLDALDETLVRADLEQAVRVVLLRGAGEDFCAGMDLREMLASVDQPPEANRRAALRLGELFLRIRALPKPVVAAVRGRALAGGCGLANACDLVLAARTAQFGYPEIQRGFVPAVVLALLKRTVGEKLAFDLASTGRVLTAGEAAAAGLVSRVSEDGRFEDEVAAVVRGLASTSATALAFTKRHFYELDGMSAEQGMQLGAAVNAVSRTTPEFRAGIEAFFKR